jgi:hypothetical protein
MDGVEYNLTKLKLKLKSDAVGQRDGRTWLQAARGNEGV